MSASTADRPWLQIYPEEVPASFQPAVRNGVELFSLGAHRRPDDPALHYFDRTLSHREADEIAHALAAGLREQGITAGDRIGLFLQNVPEFVIGLHAAWLLGAIVTPVNPMMKSRELKKQLEDAGAKLLIAQGSLYETAREGFAGTIPVASEHDLLGEAELPSPLKEIERPQCPGADQLAAIADRFRGQRVKPANTDPDDPAILVYTSGTTGPSKGAINTHGNVCFNAEVYGRWMQLGDDDVIVGMAPLFHVTGLIGHIAAARFAAIPLILFYRYDGAEMLRLVERYRGTFVIGALTAFIALLDDPNLQQRDISSLTKVYSGGAPVSPAVVERFEKLTGRYIHNAYGLTETTSPSHITPLGTRGPVDPDSGALSVGVPVSSTECKIIDVSSGEDLPPGEIGEIVTRGPMVVPGYWGRPEESARAITDGWLHTGDVGKMTDEGWFFLVDRAKDMIVASGFKVWPRDVEDVLYEHPAVREAAVVGVPDEYRGETVKAFVSLNPGQRVTPEELIAHCKKLMAAYKYPRLVEIVDEIPKTVTGKVLRRELRDRAIKQTRPG